MKYFPLFIQAENKIILIFGGGRDAAAKLRLVLKTEAEVQVVAKTLKKSEFQLGQAKWHQVDPLTFKFPENVAFAYAATGDRQLDAKIAQRARSSGVLVCAADQPAVSDFSTPAIVDRDPVIVAIGTEGTAPVLARSIKADVESLLPATLGKAASLASNLRPWVAKRVATGLARREFWQGFFKSAPASKLEARKLVEILAAPKSEALGELTFIGAGPGDAELLTLKARKALDRADVVLYTQDVSLEILELVRREALIAPVNSCGSDLVSKTTSVKTALSAVNEGENVVWVSAKTPDTNAILSAYQQAVHQDQINVIPGVFVEETQVFKLHTLNNQIRKAA